MTFEYDDQPWNWREKEQNQRFFSRPGIFQVTCSENDRVYFEESENVYQALRNFYDNLKLGICENKNLLEDWERYGIRVFRFEWIDIDEDCMNPEVRKQKLEDLKLFYRGILY